jgi:hypothetical protein
VVFVTARGRETQPAIKTFRAAFTLPEEACLLSELIKDGEVVPW